MKSFKKQLSLPETSLNFSFYNSDLWPEILLVRKERLLVIESYISINSLLWSKAYQIMKETRKKKEEQE